MKIHVYSNMHNEEKIIPFWLRHYVPIADKIFVWDDESTDKTVELLSREPKVTFLEMGQHGDDDDYWVQYMFPQYEQHSRGEADWVIVADADEFAYHPRLLEVLQQELDKGTQVILCHGYTMIAESFPDDHGQQLYDEIQYGLPDKLENKWTIHSANATIRYGKGRHGPVHGAHSFNRNRFTGIKLLHYRYFGDEYFEARDIQKIARSDAMFHNQPPYSRNIRRTQPDGTKGGAIPWFQANKHKAVRVVGEWMGDPFAKTDYWRAVMYSKLREQISSLPITGEGVEFGGSNGIIQGMLPKVTFEVRKPPDHNITSNLSYERDWDVIVADQILEHVLTPWDALKLIGEHTKQLAIITVPFLIGIHMRPRDYWRMTPRAIHKLSAPYFKSIEIGTWGHALVNYWHAIYNRTDRLFQNEKELDLLAALEKNDENKPFVIWAVLRK